MTMVSNTQNNLAALVNTTECDKPKTLDGFIESVNENVVCGWVSDESCDGLGLGIQIYADNRRIGEGVASIIRQDLYHAGYKKGAFGFVIKLETVISDAKSKTLQIKTADTRELLTKRDISEIPEIPCQGNIVLPRDISSNGLQDAANILKNPNFHDLSNIVTRNDFCTGWLLKYHGHPDQNTYVFKTERNLAGQCLNVKVTSVAKWIRVVQKILVTPDDQIAKASITISNNATLNSKGEISRISLMEIDEYENYSDHSVFAYNLEIPNIIQTLDYELQCSRFDRSKEYAFVMEFSEPIDLNIHSVKLALKNKNKIFKVRDSQNVREYKYLADRHLDTDLGPYRYYLDNATCKNVTGWVVSERDGAHIFDIDILLDGVQFTSTKNDRTRDDLASKKISTGKGGFSIDIPRGFQRNKEHVVTLKFPDGSLSSPTKLTNTNDIIQNCTNPVKNSSTNSVVIIVPVFNAFDDLNDCVSRLVKHTSDNVQIIFIDDCSTDKRIIPFLHEVANDNLSILFYQNEKNSGFSATVNYGLELAGRSDVVLLNSDARVTPRWLDSLKRAAYSQLDVATVTPFSDNAGAFSAPYIGMKNLLPPHLDEASISVAIRRNSDNLRPEIPTGNGFCMYIKRAAIDEVGVFDSDSFPKGYGEENDFCMRCKRAGWTHLLDDATYVGHARSASFGASKIELMEAGRAIIDSRYPEYAKLTVEFQSSTMELARYRVGEALSQLEEVEAVLPRALFVYSTQTGGTPKTNRDLMSAIQRQFETWTLRCDSNSMYLELFNGKSSKSIATHKLIKPISAVEHRSREYDIVVDAWLTKYDISIVHIRHLAWHSLSLPRIVSSHDIPVVNSFHDFYALCPSVNLLDENNNYCGGTCTVGTGSCVHPLWPRDSLPPLKNAWVNNWRKEFSKALSYCSAHITTSASAKKTIQKHMPSIGNQIEVIPHGRNLEMMSCAYTPPSEIRPIKIIVPGNITITKGLEVIQKVLAIDVEKRLQFHIVGSIETTATRPGMIVHGSYDRDSIANKINLIAPSVAAVFSIWDETWAHTLTEMWGAGLPVMVFDYGTVATRVRESGAGWVMQHDNIPLLYEQILSCVMDLDDFYEKRAAVAHWQRTTGTAMTVENMASHYLSVYRRLINKPRGELTLPANGNDASVYQMSVKVLDRVAVVCPSEECQTKAPASTFIRIWSRTRTTTNSRFNYLRCTPEQLIAGIETGEIRYAILQRNVLSAALTERVVNAATKKQFHYMLDLDDQLLNVPPQKDPLGIYKRIAPSLRVLISNADVLTVSTENLLKDFKNVTKRVVLLPNLLDNKLWARVSSGRFERSLDRITIVYMGSQTHDEDLRMFLPGFIDACKYVPNLHLKIIGGFSSPPLLTNNITLIEIPDESRPYPEFVKFLAANTIDVDFAVCPLVASEFNSRKSDLKFLEYSALSLAGIYSDTPVYTEIVAESGVGTLAKNSIEGWSEAIRIAVSKIDETRKEGLRAREWVLNKKLVSSSIAEFESIIFSLAYSSDRVNSPIMLKVAS